MRRDRRATRREAIIFYDGTAPYEERTEASVVAEQLVGALAEARFEISEDLGPFEWTDVDDAIEPKDFTAAVDHEGNEGLSISRMQGVALGMPDADYAAAVRIVTEIATPLGFTHRSYADFDERTVTYLYNVREGGYISIGKTFGAGFSLRFETGCRP